MQEKTITCIVCPTSCLVKIRGEPEAIDSVTGYRCRRGEAYARQEFCHPERILTTSVRVTNADRPLVPVRSSRPIPKESLRLCMACLRDLTVTAPIRRGDVLLANILETGADMIATDTISI